MSGYIKANYDKKVKDKIISFRIGASRGKDMVTGKYLYEFRTIKTDSTRIARKKLREMQMEIDKGIFIKPGKATLAEYLRSWLNDYVKPNLAPRTHELYDYICKKHVMSTLGNVPLSELKPPQLQHLYNEKQQSGLSNRTVQFIHVTLHKALKNAVKIGLLMRNVAEAVDLLLMQLSVSRTLQQLHNVPKEQRLTFKEPKTMKSRRLIKLSPSTCLLLNDYKDKENEKRKQLGFNPIGDGDLVFCKIDGSPYLPESVTHIWQKLAIKCDLKGIRLHDLRHSMASYMLKKGIHPKIVQERLGHSFVAITLDLYSHVVPGLQEAAANSLDNLISNNESRLDREIKEIIK